MKPPTMRRQTEGHKRSAKSIFTTRYRMFQRTYTDLSGYLYLVKEWRILGIKVWSQEIDREDEPAFALIQRACLGYSDWVNPIWARHTDKRMHHENHQSQ